MLRKLDFRLALIAAVLLASIFGCAAAPITQPVQPTSHLNPDTTRAPELTITPQTTSPLSPAETFPPAGTFSIQPTSTSVFIPLVTKTNVTKDIVRGLLNQVNVDRALNDLKRLAGEEPICTSNGCNTISTRLTGSLDLHLAKTYIYNELINLGFSVKYQDWALSGYSDQNIIARKPGISHPEEEIYLVAHIDSAHSPGADDNASGVVDILESARALSSYSFSRTLVLLISTGEEQGTLGVKSYLSQLSAAQLSAIKYAVNIDMVGYDANRDGVMELWHGGHSPSKALTQMMSETIQTYQLSLKPDFVVGCG